MRKALLAILPVVLGAATACASAQAKGANDKPALDVPPPPPHVIELPAEPLEPVAEVPGSNTPPGGSGTARPGRVTREAPPRPAAEAKPETKPDTPPPPEPPAPVAPAPTPAPQLKTPQTADTETAARSVRTTIDRANRTLGGVDYRPLSNERKKAYDDAKLSLKQAEDALKQGNIVFAQAMATKAETLARELAGR